MTQMLALTCPVCGGPLDPRSERCGFCGSYIVIKSDMPKLKPASLKQSVIRESILDFRSRTYANPRDQEAHYGLGVAYFTLGLISDAISELTMAAKMMPENPHIQTQLATVLREAWIAGDRGAEIPMRERIGIAMTLDPENVDANVLRIRIALDEMNFGKAVGDFETIPAEAQVEVRALVAGSLTKVCLERIKGGEFEGAQWCWQHLVIIDPNAAKELVCAFLKNQKHLVPKRYNSRDSQNGEFPRGKIGGTAILVGVGVAGCFLGSLLIVAVNAVGGAVGGGVESFLALAGFVGWLASPFLAIMLFRKRPSLGRNDKGPNDRNIALNRKKILACEADFESLDKVATAVISRSRSSRANGLTAAWSVA